MSCVFFLHGSHCSVLQIRDSHHHLPCTRNRFPDPFHREKLSVYLIPTSQSVLNFPPKENDRWLKPVSYTHLRAHETVLDLVCRLLLEKKKKKQKNKKQKT